MADDKVWGVKMAADEHADADKLFEKAKEMGLFTTKKDFLRALLSDYELKLSKETIDYANLEELEILISRTKELFVNVVKQKQTIQEDADKRYNELESEKKNDLQRLQLKLEIKNDMYTKQATDNQELQEEIKRLEERILELETMNNKNESLIIVKDESIQNLKDKVLEKEDTIDSLKIAGEENSKLKEEMKELNHQLQQKQQEITQLEKKLTESKEKHNEEVRRLNKQYTSEISRLEQQKEFDKNQALFELEVKLKQDQQAVVDRFNERISNLLSKFSNKEEKDETVIRDKTLEEDRMSIDDAEKE